MYTYIYIYILYYTILYYTILYYTILNHTTVLAAHRVGQQLNVQSALIGQVVEDVAGTHSPVEQRHRVMSREETEEDEETTVVREEEGERWQEKDVDQQDSRPLECPSTPASLSCRSAVYQPCADSLPPFLLPTQAHSLTHSLSHSLTLLPAACSRTPNPASSVNYATHGRFPAPSGACPQTGVASRVPKEAVGRLPL